MDSKPSENSGQLTVYVSSDAHVGRHQRDEHISAFVNQVNADRPDLVIDCGDCTQALATDFYNYDTDREAALAQQEDFVAAWSRIDKAIPHATTLGNHDLSSSHGKPSVLGEEAWIAPMGWSHRPAIGGSRVQTAFTVDPGAITARVLVFSTYSRLHNMEETLAWAEAEIRDVSNDLLLLVNHNANIYRDLQKIISKHPLKNPALFLHGHNHGHPTGTRDAWGYEQEDLVFPCWLQPALCDAPRFSKFVLAKEPFSGQVELGGSHRIYEGDLAHKTFRPAVINYQTRVTAEP